jgi:hypothetical protein
MKRTLPASIDLSLLEFLEHGDLTLIAEGEKKEGRKTSKEYVWKVCNGYIRNDRILKKAFDLALKRRSAFPIEALKVA